MRLYHIAIDSHTKLIIMFLRILSYVIYMVRDDAGLNTKFAWDGDEVSIL
jgi:hypothetical protein